MTWFISDTHYHHKNIVRGVSEWTDKNGCRDFDTLDAHNNWLVDYINQRVNRLDTLWHLGDWSFGGKDRVKEFRDRINCENVHIVLGNHDQHILNSMGLFKSVQPYKELAISGLNVLLCHYPIESWNNMERGAIHLHGHVHGQGTRIDGRLDVGVDAVGLVNLDMIKIIPKATIQRHTSIAGGNKFGN